MITGAQDLVTHAELQEGLGRVLEHLGLSVAQLEQEASVGRFSSERARSIWLAYVTCLGGLP